MSAIYGSGPKDLFELDTVWGIFLNSMVEYVRSRIRQGAGQESESKKVASEALMKIGPDLIREFTAMIALSDFNHCSDGDNLECSESNPLAALTQSVAESYLAVKSG
jgi:hypothetical protein